MDALQLLKSEHDDLEALLTKLERAHGAQARHLLAAVKDQHDMIEALEGTHLYPLLRNDDLAREIVLDGYEDHRLIDALFKELSQMKPDDPAWRPKVHVLKEDLERHIRMEEDELFPKVRLIWNTDKLRHLYRKMEQLKAKWKKEKVLGLLPA